jgi:transcriptional regulator with XRE-family HTH domain
MVTKYNRRALGSLMREQGLTAAELAPRVKLSRQGLTYLAKGFQEPGVSTLARLATVLGVDVRVFFTTSS